MKINQLCSVRKVGTVYTIELMHIAIEVISMLSDGATHWVLKLLDH